MLGVETFLLEGNSFHLLEQCKEYSSVHWLADYYFRHWGDIVELQTPSGVILFSAEEWQEILDIVQDFLARADYWLIYSLL